MRLWLLYGALHTDFVTKFDGFWCIFLYFTDFQRFHFPPYSQRVSRTALRGCESWWHGHCLSRPSSWVWGPQKFPFDDQGKRPPVERHFHGFFILWVTGLLCPSHVGGTWWTAQPPCTLDPKLKTLPAPRGSGRWVSGQRDLDCFGLSFHSLPLNDFH